ncbi:protein mono-ADP-ribosyltransferase PARP15-like [Dysidea avara]|uniref:protein mono-ADP-ribosyltransferase PARP15-like n=1 Tax=Dysidea avara TaxID=196820 RepID=UPI0033325BEA
MVSYPSTWKSAADGKLANTLSLDANDLEYIQIKKEFEATVSVISIVQIQNPTLCDHYAVRKRFIDESNPTKTTNERWLYHGCNETDEQSIRLHGFGWKDITFVTHHDTITPIMKRYGEAICFTVKASSSVHPIYSPADSRGHRRMFLACVLTGE